jgi:hypothetical protein
MPLTNTDNRVTALIMLSDGFDRYSRRTTWTRDTVKLLVSRVQLPIAAGIR